MTQDRVMLLIDADNVSVDVMEQAVRLLLNQHGGLHVRRAYCTAESAVKHQPAFKRLGIKPMVNLAAGKNSTDIALAVDAIDLVLAERPQVVVIASSDSDFAPLVMRLREKGCVVRGIGQAGKTGAETQEVYDDYTVLEHRRSAAGAAAPARKAAARKTTARKTVARKAAAEPQDDAASADEPPAAGPARKAPAKKAAARKTAAKKSTPAKTGTTARKAAAARKAPAEPAAAAAAAPAAEPAIEHAAPPAPAETRPARGRRAAAETPARPQRQANGGAGRHGPISVDAVLMCLPELVRGQGLALNVAAQRLREAQLLSKNSSSPKLFAQLSDRFELVPHAKPTQVRLRR